MSTHHDTPTPPIQPPSPPLPAAPPTGKTGDSDPALRELLTTFHARWLGEDDLNTGANLLVARAVMLSDLSRIGSGIDLGGHKGRIKVGGSLFVSGGLAAGFVVESIGEVAIRQNHLTAQIERLIRTKTAEAQSKRLKLVEFPSGPALNLAEESLLQLQNPECHMREDPLEGWREVLSASPNARIEDLALRSKILVTARGPRDLENQLKGIHGNRALVSLSLNDPAEVGSYAGTCHALLSGPYPIRDYGETLMANLIVTDPGNVLARVAPGGGNQIAWIARMVWLVDGTTGPDAADNRPDPRSIPTSDTSGRYGSALVAVLAKRLNNHDASPVVHQFDLATAQIRWANFLKRIENRLPGISGTARRLPATLAFGLLELAQAPHHVPLTVTPAGVEALAKWVIRRMAAAREALLRTAEIEEKQRLAKRIQRKLVDGQLSKRELCRALSITATSCEEVLFALNRAGVVRQVDDDWELVEPKPIAETALATLFLGE